MVLTHQGAELSVKKPNALAKEILERIQYTVDNYRLKHNWKIYGMGAAFSVLSIITLWQVIYWNSRVFLARVAYWRQLGTRAHLIFLQAGPLNYSVFLSVAAP